MLKSSEHRNETTSLKDDLELRGKIFFLNFDFLIFPVPGPGMSLRMRTIFTFHMENQQNRKKRQTREERKEKKRKEKTFFKMAIPIWFINEPIQ